jgi:hypothetical protein
VERVAIGFSYAAPGIDLHQPTPFTMTTVFLALVPLVFATGSLTWLMTMGAKAQAESDAWADQWVRDNG